MCAKGRRAAMLGGYPTYYLSGVSAALCKVCAVPEGLLCAVSDMPGSLCMVSGARVHVG